MHGVWVAYRQRLACYGAKARGKNTSLHFRRTSGKRVCSLSIPALQLIPDTISNSSNRSKYLLETAALLIILFIQYERQEEREEVANYQAKSGKVSSRKTTLSKGQKPGGYHIEKVVDPLYSVPRN